METVQNETVSSTESSSAVPCINKTDTDEILSKEKEDELLCGAEDDGDDEDALSDDSLRLRLSDDEDAEQEEHPTTNCTNILESKLQSRKAEQPPAYVEEKAHLDTQQIVEKVIKFDGKELTKGYDSAIKVPENSTLSSNEYISENKTPQNNSENSSTATIANESSETCTLDTCDTIQSVCEEISPIIRNIKNGLELTYVDHDKDTVEMLDSDTKREDGKIKHISNFDKDLKVSQVNDASMNALSKQDVLENNNVTIESSNHQSTKPATHNEGNLKETVDDRNNETNSASNYKSNNLNTDSVSEVKIRNSERSSASENNDDNLTILSDKIVDKVSSTYSAKNLLTEVNDSEDSTNAIRSYSFGDDSSSRNDIIEYESKEHNTEHEDMTTQSANIQNAQSVQQETSISLVKNQNDSFKDKTKTENHDIKECVNQIEIKSVPRKNVLLPSTNAEDINNENKNKNTSTIVQSKKRLRKSAKLEIDIQDCATEEDEQEEKEGGRKKRRTAKHAEEIIRKSKKYLNSDSDSSDSEEEFVTLNHNVNKNLHPASPPSLKRNCPDNDDPVSNGIFKKLKMSAKSEKNDVTKLSFIEKFFQRDIKDKLTKLKQEELEELLIQKIVETLTMRSEIGQLREQARISEKNQEATRMKLQQLTKQVKDFEMVLNRNAIDRRTNPDKFIAPIKINRSVGLQVNFITEHGIQNLRQIQQTSHPSKSPANGTNGAANSANNSSVPEPNDNTSPRRGIKIRSPRRSEAPMVASAPTISQSPMQTAPLISTVTPAALVVAKPLESQHTLTLSNQPSSFQQILPAPQQSIQPKPQAIVLNGNIQNQVNRPSPTQLIAPKPRSNLIDLTDEEEKNKSKVMNVSSASLIEHQLKSTSKSAQCFPKVIQTIPANVAITAQPTNIRVVQPNSSTANTIMNNITLPRLSYVATRQVLLASSATQIRPVTTVRPSFPTVTYKTTGISTITNGAVRVLTPAASNVQISKHPAPLPDTPNYTVTPGWKLPPPAPSLKISKVSNGIVLSWNMNLSDKYADIASYQLYAYQEVAGVNPSTSLWKKVGDVRALPLPMACTLTQFSEGNNYYFAVRAVDTHSRKGQYSVPGNISL